MYQSIPDTAPVGSATFFESLAEQARREGTRLTAMVVLLNGKGEVGIGQQNNAERNWSLPQGRVKESEDAEDGALRELRLELGLNPGHLAGRLEFLFTGRIPYPQDRKDARYPGGKRYVCFWAEIASRAQYDLIPNREMLNWIWIPPDLAKLFCIDQPGATKHPAETKQKGEAIIARAIDMAYARFVPGAT